MKIRIEGYIPVRDFSGKIHSDHDLYYIFDSLRYGPIHEENEMTREELIKEFQKQYLQFHEDYCRVIQVGEERQIGGGTDQ